MIVECELHGARLEFRCRPEQRDHPDRPDSSLVRTRWWVEVPSGTTLEGIHPDLIALASVLMMRPFSRTITVPIPASRGFAEAVAPLQITNVDEHLAPRRPGAAPGLAFSGGVDSTAALDLLPADTVAVHGRARPPAEIAARNRIRRLLGRPHSKASTRAATRAVGGAARLGHRTLLLDTDATWVRRPPGFTVDVACAVPLVLAADHLGLDSAAFGTVMESAYRVGHRRFEDYTARDHPRLWGRPFAAAGLAFHLVTAGLSEVATTAVARSSPLGGFAQSCVRGGAGGACLRCFKCFRTATVRAALTGRWPGDDQLERLMRSPHAAHHLRRVPIHHENVVAFAMERYPGSNPLAGALRDRVLAGDPRLGWMERWYPPAADAMAPHRRSEAIAALASKVDPMDDADVADASGWDLAARLDTPEYRAAAARFAALLDG